MLLPILIPIQIEISYTPIFVSKLRHVIVNNSVICIIISVFIVISNLIDYFINGYNNEISAVILIHVFSALFVVFSLLCVAGAMKQILACLKLGFLMWIILTIIWLTICCVQFSSWYTVKDVCINNRCPESLWLSDIFYLSFEEEKVQNSTKPANNTSPNMKHPPEKVSLKRHYLFIVMFVFIFISFSFFFIFLGSMIYSFHDAICYLRESPEDQLITVPPGAFIFIYPLRKFYEAGPSSGLVEAADNQHKEETTENQNKNKAGTTDKPKSENTAEVKSPQTSGK